MACLPVWPARLWPLPRHDQPLPRGQQPLHRRPPVVLQVAKDGKRMKALMTRFKGHPYENAHMLPGEVGLCLGSDFFNTKTQNPRYAPWGGEPALGHLRFIFDLNPRYAAGLP